jgi:polar amino acid transport system permease protein
MDQTGGEVEESVAARSVGESPGRSDDRIPGEIRAIPLRRPGRWISAVLVLLAAGWLIHAFAESPNINYDIVWKYQLS